MLVSMKQPFIRTSEFDLAAHLSLQVFTPGKEIGSSFRPRTKHVYLEVIRSALGKVNGAGGYRVRNRGVGRLGGTYTVSEPLLMS